MSEDKISKTSKELKLQEEKEADISSDIAEVQVGDTDTDIVVDSEPVDTEDAEKVEDKEPEVVKEDPRQQGARGGKGFRPRKPRQEREPSEFEEKMLSIDRVTRVVKGGRRMRFRVLMIVGDKKGRIGFGVGKGNEVALAAQKASSYAKKRLIKVDIAGGTLPHDVMGKSRGSEVLLKSSKKGRGIIAGGGVRVVLELAGYSDVVAKSFGSNNKINTVIATLNALQSVLPRSKKPEKTDAKPDSDKKSKDKKVEKKETN